MKVRMLKSLRLRHLNKQKQHLAREHGRQVAIICSTIEVDESVAVMTRRAAD